MLEGLVIFIGLLFSDFLNGSSLFELGKAFKPDFILIFTVYFALRKGPFWGIWIGFFGGLLTDADIGIINIGVEVGKEVTLIGLHSLAYTLVGWIVGQFVRAVYRETRFSAFLVIFAAAFVTRLLVWGTYSLFFGSIESYLVFRVALYTGVLGSIVWFFLLDKLYRLEAKEEYF